MAESLAAFLDSQLKRLPYSGAQRVSAGDTGTFICYIHHPDDVSIEWSLVDRTLGEVTWTSAAELDRQQRKLHDPDVAAFLANVPLHIRAFRQSTGRLQHHLEQFQPSTPEEAVLHKGLLAHLCPGPATVL